MANDTTVESTTENAALIPKRGALQSFFDFFGAKSVSLSTASAVVISCVMILVSDYVFTSFIV